MHEVLTDYGEISKLPSKDVLAWVCEKVWREIAWHEQSGPRPILSFEVAQRKEDSTFIFADPCGSIYRGGSIEAVLRTAILAEVQSGQPFLREWTPRQSRNGNHARRR